MKLLNVNLNSVLFLENYVFKNNLNNIEFLNERAIEENDLLKKLELLNKATRKIEKFHSFFHFEQSFFHLQYALQLLEEKLVEDANAQLDLAIFQDHENQQAKNIKNHELIQSNYQRTFKSFTEYLSFATEEKIDKFETHIFWEDFSNKDLKLLIQELRNRHLQYHQESAKLYLNRAIIFKSLQDFELAKNDLTKAKNLDSNLEDKEYFKDVVPCLGHKIALSLGSNLGDREKYLSQAIESLANEKILYNRKASDIEATKALLKPNSPKAWDKEYLNQVIIGYSFFTPEELLKKIKNLEIKLGRTPKESWAPREIDIDILLYDSIKIEHEYLTIPHKEINNRPWILSALDQLIPEWRKIYEQN